MGITVKQLLTLALEQEGYLEKASPANEDSMTENAGINNYTKFGRDLAKNVGSPYADGVAWCDNYVDWLFWKLGGKQAIQENLYGLSAYTPTSAQYFKNNNAWYTGKSPKPGYQIFFKNSQRICHTGLVVKCENGMVYTIEGNTSSAKGVVANGGCVRQKSYSVSYANIAGYGIPKCVATQAAQGSESSPVVNPTPSQVKKAQQKHVKEVQKFINKYIMPDLISKNVFKSNLEVDGIYGKMTRQAILAYWKQLMNNAYKTSFDMTNSYFGPSCNNASIHSVVVKGDSSVFVLTAQLLLKSRGYYEGNITGNFDEDFCKAVINFEKDKGLIVNSINSANIGPQVWYAMFN